MSEPNAEVTIIVADDDAGHARLIEKNLSRAGLNNPVRRFENGQEVLDFLIDSVTGRSKVAHGSYLLLLDIRMPQVDGVEVLRQLKQHPELRIMPVVMLTTTDDPDEVSRCHLIGCSHYIVKPVAFDKFAETIKNLGLFISLVKFPELIQPSAP